MSVFFVIVSNVIVFLAALGIYWASRYVPFSRRQHRPTDPGLNRKNAPCVKKQGFLADETKNTTHQPHGNRTGGAVHA